jgi:hypothetical protein
MKKIFTILLCISGVVANAQDNNTLQQIEVAENWPYMLTNIGTSQITSGILYDKVTSFSNFLTFNRPENNVSSFEHFNQTISELNRASDYSRFITSQELKNRIALTTANNAVDIGIINTSYQKLNYNEKYPNDGGLLFQNGKFVAISGKPSFLTRKALIISPLKDIISGSSATFKFNSNLIFNNTSSSLKKLVVDFGDGVNVIIINNGNILLSSKTVNYVTKGQKFIKFVATMQDNTVITTYGQIYFNYINNYQTQTLEQLPCYENLKDKGLFTSTIPFQGYDETSGVFGKIEYTIFYHNNNGNTLKKILKPLIIIDGFDPKDKRKVLDCDCENDPTCFLNNSTVSISGSTYTRTFNPSKHISIEEMMYYQDFLANGDLVERNLIPKLRELGYDVIIINNPSYTSINQAGTSVSIDGGADYIERNAMNLVSYIQSIKNTLIANGSNEKLVIVGPSMGGQISRYALAYMDKKYAETSNPIWIHNARLWISIDSPHLGANIPLAAQANIWFLGEKLYSEKARKQFNEELNSVAAKQQLISQFQQGLNTGNTNNSPFFNTFYNNLNTNGVTSSGGYPITTTTFRKIALVNGSLNGTKVGTENQTFLKMRGYIDLSFLFFNWTITHLRMNDMFMPATGQTATIFQGDGQNFNIGLDHWYISHPKYSVSVTNNSLKGSLDVIPGGLFSAQKYIKEGVEDALSDAGARNQTQAFLPSHSFIPSFSALGHLQPNQNWGNPLNVNLTCSTNRQTPFDSYFGLSKNTQHTSFTKESVDWLLKELAGQPQAPYFPVEPNTLAGLDKICLNTNSSYSFANSCVVPSAVTTWSISSNLELISQSGYGIVVKGIENGQGTITAVFQNGQILVKNIWVGSPTFKEIVFGTANTHVSLCLAPASNYSFSIPELNNSNKIKAVFDGLTTAELDSNANWEWTASNNLIMLNGTKDTREICPMGSGQTGISVRAKNACGWSEWYELPFEITELPLYEKQNPSVYTVYPNPSKDIVTIDLKNKERQPEKTALISGELFDVLGISKAKIEIKNNKASFYVNGLIKGIYILKIYLDGQVESHQIAVE